MNTFILGSIAALYYPLMFGSFVLSYFWAFRYLNPKHEISTKRSMGIGLVLLFGYILIGILGKILLGLDLSLAEGFLELGFLVLGCLWVRHVTRISLGRSVGTMLLLLVFYSFVCSATLFCVRLQSMPSGSMEDTISAGDLILSNELAYGHSFAHETPRYFRIGSPQRGDLITFYYPPDPGKIFLKRCVGLPGDVIQLKEGALYVNGAKQVEPYVKHLMTPEQARAMDGLDSKKVNFGPVTVEPGNYFTLGDNRDNSLDSRYWGTVDERMILGKVMGICWHHGPYFRTFP